MKDFLENLEIGENKVKLSQEEIKSIFSFIESKFNKSE